MSEKEEDIWEAFERITSEYEAKHGPIEMPVSLEATIEELIKVKAERDALRQRIEGAEKHLREAHYQLIHAVPASGGGEGKDTTLFGMKVEAHPDCPEGKAVFIDRESTEVLGVIDAERKEEHE